MTVYNGALIARGWLSAAVASSTDKERPQLNRTVSIESYPEGVRLVATDSYILLSAWIPSIDHHQEPDLDEAPVATAVAMDPHGRAKGFFAHVLKLAAEADRDGEEAPEVRLSLGVVEEVDDGTTLPGMECLYVVVELPDAERLKLQTYEGAYPDWRKLTSGFEPVVTSAIALNPDNLGQLAKVGKLHDGKRLGWTFGGHDKMARVEVIESDPVVSGYAMPCRWDLDTDGPREDVEQDDAPS